MAQLDATNEARATFVARADRVLVVLSSACLVLMLAVVVVSVVMRYVFDAPLMGSNEIVQLVSVALIMFAIPHGTFVDVHVRVDIFDPVLGRHGRLFGDLLARILAAVVLGILAWRMGYRAVDAQVYGDVTNMVRWPLWPFLGLISASMILNILALMSQVPGLFAEYQDRDA